MTGEMFFLTTGNGKIIVFLVSYFIIYEPQLCFLCSIEQYLTIYLPAHLLRDCGSIVISISSTTRYPHGSYSWLLLHCHWPNRKVCFLFLLFLALQFALELETTRLYPPLSSFVIESIMDITKCIYSLHCDRHFAVGSADSLVSLWVISEMLCVRTFTKLE
jgi:hypothetical protein